MLFDIQSADVPDHRGCFTHQAMLLQQAMFSSSLSNLIQPPSTSPLSSTSTTSSSKSQMMDISPLERAFAEERERAINKTSPPIPPLASNTASAADHNGNNGEKTTASGPPPFNFPFHPASLAAAFHMQRPPVSTPGTVLNLSSSQKSSPGGSATSEAERTRSPSTGSGSYKETDRSSEKEGKFFKNV